jgi:TonB family protein
MLVASIRAGGGAATEKVPAGGKLPGAGEGSGGTGGDGPGTGAGGAGREGTGTELLREKIQAKIVYPEEAIRRGQEGEVLLRIRIGDGGVPKQIRVARSSGTRVLDEAARRGVVSASPLPSAAGWVEIPVRFFLR